MLSSLLEETPSLSIRSIPIGNGYSMERLSADRWKKSASMVARLIMDAKDAVALFNAFLTPLIAIVAVYIAWQQWQTNKHKLELELYDRRLRIYEEVRKILSINEIYRRGLHLWKWNTQYREASQENSPASDHAKVVEEIDKELT